MNEKLKMALEKLEQSPEIKAEAKKNPPKTMEDIIAIAAKLGVELTKEELEAEAKGMSKEMSLEDLNQLAGGGKMDPEEDCGSGAGFACILTLGSVYWMFRE